MEDARVSSSSDFGRLLRYHRLAAGLSQEALAERARVSANGISALERGHRRTPQRETLALLGAALALSEEQRPAFEAAAHSSLDRRHGGPSVTVASWPGAAAGVLPLALTRFVGRVTELEEIAALVRAHRLVTLTGAGGVGKTQTALQVASTMRDAEEVAVAFVGLAPVADPALVTVVIASALGVRQAPSLPLLETLVDSLKNKTLLLILDNCEHVIAQAAIVAESILSGCPLVRVLATSREPLRGAGEYAYRLPPLASPPVDATRTLTAASASAYGAVALFTDRACAVDHHFALTDESAPIVGEICRRLDGIPLAIELAAARMNVLSLNGLNEKLDDRFQILTRGERTALTRQQTMRATIDWSYDLLSAREQEFFERLSVFGGGCTLEAATGVCTIDGEGDLDEIDLIASLVSKSLLIAELLHTEQRYWLLESSRQYAREKLAARGEWECVARRHASFYVELAERLECEWDTRPESEMLSRTKAELGNWRAALDWTFGKQGDVILGQRLATTRRVIWRGFTLAEARHWVRAASELVDERTPPDLVARLALAQAHSAAYFCEDKVLLAASERALMRYREIGDVLGMARAQSLAGAALVHLGRFAQGEALLRDALAAARTLGNRHLEFATLSNLGSALSGAGDFGAARAHLTEALELSEAGVDHFKVTLDLALCEYEAGDPKSGLRLLAELLATNYASHSISSPQAAENNISENNIAMALVNMAEFLVALGRYDEARVQANEALEFARASQLDMIVEECLEHLAVVAVLGPQSDSRCKSDDYEGAAADPRVRQRSAQAAGARGMRLANSQSCACGAARRCRRRGGYASDGRRHDANPGRSDRPGAPARVSP